MPPNLRLALTVFKVGFAAESAGGFFALANPGSNLPFHGYLLALGPVVSALGILFLWVGRHEWNETHRARVRFANAAFAVSLIALALAAGPVAYLTATGGTSPPGWLAVVFGLAIALTFGVTFVTYALVAAHLVGPLGRVAMGLGLAWSVLVSALIGLALAPELSPLVRTISTRSTNLDPVTHPIVLLDALLAFSYLAFFVAFTDAHWRVAKGIDGSGNTVPPVRAGATSTRP